MKPKKPLTFLLAVLALSVIPAGAQAQSAIVPPATSTIISLGGRQIMNIRTGAGGYTAAQRADAVRERLVPILSIANLTPADVHVSQSRPKQDASIDVRGHLLITVDRTLAHANGMTPGALASKWAAALAAVLPQVNVHPNKQGI